MPTNEDEAFPVALGEAKRSLIENNEFEPTHPINDTKKRE